MTEPTTPSIGGALLLATLTAAVGPLLAEWALILVGGFVGSFLAVTALETLTLRAAAVVLARGLGMSLLFTGLLAALAAPHLGASSGALLLPVAGAIGWKQDRLLRYFKLVTGKKDSP